ncbi:MAG: phosphate signaling complex protein PhoU [Halofilum sp. (in: g-proteobacteria)]|nr:phosphate signaling complex protein PhoU [Halofilum sp. (in: g-proteobacteria)]
MGQHISSEFESELEHLRSKTIAMSGLVEQQLRNGLHALLEGDSELGRDVIANDGDVDAFEIELDEECIRLIARRQPAASDLRTVVALIKVIIDLERIGDEAEKLGRFGIELAQGSEAERAMLVGVRHLGEHARGMLHEALEVFVRQDAAAARRVALQESAIDSEYDDVVRHLVTHMILMEDPAATQAVLAALWCARALERVADHARNLCEFVVYMVEGVDIRHGGPPRRASRSA